MNIVPKSGTIAKVIRPSPELCKEALDLAAVIVSCDETTVPFTTCMVLGVKEQDNVAGRFWHESLTELINELIEDKEIAVVVVPPEVTFTDSGLAVTVKPGAGCEAVALYKTEIPVKFISAVTISGHPSWLRCTKIPKTVIK